MTRTIFLLSFFIATAFSLHAQTKIIALHHNGNPTYHTDLDSAYYYALPGDTMYLPGGDFFPTGSGGTWVISKRIHVLGAGYRADSSAATGPTRIIGKLIFATGSDSASAQGFQVTAAIDINADLKGILLSRMAISEYLFIGNNAHGNIIKECLIFAIPYPYDCMNLSSSYGNNFYNCVFSGNIADGGTANSFENCVLNSGEFAYGYYCSFKNCIFISAVNNTYQTSYTTLDHCIMPGTGLLGNFPNLQGTVTNATIANVLTSYSDPVIINNNYNLKVPPPGNINPAIGGGNLGQDCGIYDGLFPFKDNRHPSHPRITFKDIAPYTDANGDLQVEVKTEAQKN
ncbi:MAG: hypothetical protein KDD99_03410 [Bacteroidetes bacterium]|nr:hypothetical protein [Bacteroidota bacterium]